MSCVRVSGSYASNVSATNPHLQRDVVQWHDAGMENSTIRRSAEKREHWKRLAEAWKTSGLSRAAFARHDGLRPNHFTWWLRRLAEEEQHFVEVAATNGAAEGADVKTGVCVVVGETHVRLSSHFDEQTLRRVLALLRSLR